MSRPSSIAKYLDTYAEPEVALLSHLPPASWQACLIVPAYDESDSFLHAFIDTFEQQQTPVLLILVVNRPDPVPAPPANRQLIESAKALFPHQHWQQKHLQLRCRQNCSLLLVDRSSALAIPRKQGVGLARKLGADLACSLFSSGHLQSAWFYSSDADASLPANYFQPHAAQQNPNTSAVIFEFGHYGEPHQPHTEATQLYEQHLRYFKQALAFAGSPYAYFALGSILAISIGHYCQARGFPKRAAGEDFYLLNKLAKLGEISDNPHIIIQLRARGSHRVPFGTGPTVDKMLRNGITGASYNSYNPAIFVRLKKWLEVKNSFWQTLSENTLPRLDTSCEITAVMETLNVNAFFRHCLKQCNSEAQFQQQFHQWFDAFVTLKFIHHLQNSAYPPVNLHTARQTLDTLRNA